MPKAKKERKSRVTEWSAKAIKPVRVARAYAGASGGWFYVERGRLKIVVELNHLAKSGIVEIRKSQLRRWLNVES